MKPIRRDYVLDIQKKGHLADNIRLVEYYSDGQNPRRFRLCDEMGDSERGLSFPWMTKDEIVKYLRLAADKIEKAELE